MRRRAFLKTALAGTAGLAAAARAGAKGPQEPPPRPNILWLSAEDISPLLGCYGDTFAQTPNLDAFAAQGVRYDRAYAHAPVCSPSRSGIITGVYPSTLGTHQHRSRAVLPPHIRCFTEYLRQAGYCCTNNAKKDYNFQDAPESWDESGSNAHWRNRKPGQPFFSVFNYTVSHESLLHKTDAEFDALCTQWGIQRHDPAAVRLPAYHPDTPEFRKDWARYYDALTILDLQVAQRLKELEADGLAENTIVAFWGDHGTGITRGKRWLYESGTRVPLLMRFPDAFRHLAPGAPGAVETRPLVLLDLAPTMLSLAGVPVPEYMQGRAFLGAQARPPRQCLFFVRDRMDEINDCIRSVRGQRFRYIRNFYPHVPYDQYNEYLYKERSAQAWHRLAGAIEGAPALFLRPEKPIEELYDTEADPDEVRDLAQDPAYRSTLLDMRRRLNAWMIETGDLGLLDEAEMYRRAQDGAAMDLGRSPKSYHVARVLETANLALDGQAALPELLKRLKDSDSAVRYWAATGIAVLKPGPSAARSALLEHLDDDSQSVRVAVAHALCRIGRHEEALPLLAALLKSSDRFVCRRALNVLALQQKKAAALRPDVESLRSHPDAEIQRAASSALVRIDE